jgi:hypothetical protein
MDASKREPAPKPNNNKYVVNTVVTNFLLRDDMGTKKYGTHLQPGNGRDSLKDALQEAMDLVMYLTQAIMERDGEV